MLGNSAVLNPKQIVVRSGRFGACLDQTEHEIAIRNVATRYQHRGVPGLFHLGDPRFHPCGPITNFGGMLNVVITCDEFVNTIKVQFNGYDLLEVTNESSISLCLFAIDNSGRTIELCMPGRIGTGLGSLSAPMFDNLAVLEAKEVKRYNRPRKARPAFIFRMKH